MLILYGCSPSPENIWRDFTISAKTKYFFPVDFNVSPFHLKALLKGQLCRDGQALVIYIEGDGRAVVQGRVSSNPTPYTATGLDLALLDPAPVLLYLARIGQFQNVSGLDPAYWSERRLSEEAVQAASNAINQAKVMTGCKVLHLVGYSGGGGIASLLAETRDDVATLTTVAGLLDTGWWVRENNFLPLTGSLNPADQADRLINIHQIHFYGETDSVIQPGMSAHFKSLAPFQSFKRVPVPTNHWRNWDKLWPGLLSDYVLPMRQKKQLRGIKAEKL